MKSSVRNVQYLRQGRNQRQPRPSSLKWFSSYASCIRQLSVDRKVWGSTFDETPDGMSYGNNNNNNNSFKHLSASEMERRAEESRRRNRKDDVVIGTTSAIRGATDFALNVAATQELWLKQASALERIVFQSTDEGMQHLKMLRLKDADRCFDAVFAIKPNAYLWQAGIVKFYLGHIQEASAIFAKCAGIYESKFGEPATEERIWRHACALKLYHQRSRKDKKMLQNTASSPHMTPLSDTQNVIGTTALSSANENNSTSSSSTSSSNRSVIDSLVPPIQSSAYIDVNKLLLSERRRVMKITRQLFASSVVMEDEYPNIALEIVSRAKLRQMGHFVTASTPSGTNRIVMDRKLWKLNSWFYLGLHYDVLGDTEASKHCMKMALRLCPTSVHGSDIVHTLPMLHMTCRDWFDEEEVGAMDHENENVHFGAFAGFNGIQSTTTGESTPVDKTEVVSETTHTTMNEALVASMDPIFIQSILHSIDKLKLHDLQQSMKLRNLKLVGSKEELQQRFFFSILHDTELLSS